VIKPSQIMDLERCEAELDAALADLRRLTGAGVTSVNLIAQASTEYRIGARRRRREALR
jgi:hypothetical protein